MFVFAMWLSLAQAGAPTPKSVVTRFYNVYFARKESRDVIKWRGAVLVTTDGGRFAIDDVLFEVDEERPARLFESFRGCGGRRWLDGP